MTRFLVIGLGHFGSWAARALAAQGHEIVAVDRKPEVVDAHADELSRVVVGDGTRRALLSEIGAEGASAAIISTGEDLAASLLATMAAKELGIEDVYVKVTSDDSRRALEVLAVRETVFPEREVAQRLARRIPTRGVLEYVPLSSGHSIQEIAIPPRWVGATLRELGLPHRHGVQVVAIYDSLAKELRVAPDPALPLRRTERLIVAGPDDTIRQLLRSS